MQLSKEKLLTFNLRYISALFLAIILFLMLQFMYHQVVIDFLEEYDFFNISFYNLSEFILEISIVLICWNIFLLLIFSYKYTNNLRNLFVSVSFLFAGTMNIIHAILVFSDSYLKYNSSSEVFSISARLIVVIAVLFSWLVKDREKYNLYYISFSILISFLSSITISYVLFKLWMTYEGIILIIKFVLIIMLAFNIRLYNREFLSKNDNSSLYIAKGFIFLLLSEALSLFQVDVFSSLYFLLHLYKFIAFYYIFKSIFIDEITEGILAKKEVDLKNIKLELKEEKIKDLRVQRHDFKNQLQTIYTMVQMDKFQEAEEYIKELHIDLDFMDTKVLKDNILYSVFLPKKQEAIKRGIDLKIKMDVDLSMIIIPNNKIIKILFNLIDNAIDALDEVDIPNKKIIVELMDRDNSIYMIVYNNGATISDDLMSSNIFEPGYSTKGENRGFGLYIVKSLLEEYGGEINVKSKRDNGTSFICKLPKRNQELSIKYN
ncbi:sensor histidine kinase [Orenia marismortui]|uniref:histidine kinase n=1 Tax=Orenia marismortui TaxID=46469 RepID=A0A4R8H9L4_9FIRM|nr:ATP-binding protein [Orenia marismortui]TDX52767.1 sensor kinase SpoOB-type protein [Orenia marismortui]